MTEAAVIDVEDLARENRAFRHVILTAERSQLVLMSLEPGEDIGAEIHTDVDQLIYVVEGDGEAEIAGSRHPFATGAIFCVPAGARHDVVNTGNGPMKLFTIYAPPQHADGTLHRTKADALAAEREPALR